MEENRFSGISLVAWLIMVSSLLPFHTVSAQSEEDWIRGAKKEGHVMFWSSMRIDDSRALAAGFESRYPYIKVEIYRAGGEQLVNRSLVESAAGKTTYDVINARWKGKLGMDNEEYFWYAGMVKHWGEEKGKRYMEALARQDLQWRSGHGLLADLMSTGEFPLAVVVYPDAIENMKSKGQPVEWVKTTDPILVNLAPVGIAAKAPHPNSAKLFLNYTISKEGQEILRKRNRISARLDAQPLVPDMDPGKLRLVPLDPEIPTHAKYIEEFRRIF